ncbi:PBP superfamily domain protein [Vibrio mediterranei]|nr:substrate-binding domain-containing protein [Vibrio mediterranei]MCG9662670.1 substrate-binding domain-containing protein [Vibrio mediterranei]SBO08115.1 PBP superfamily domain protein [Vibrio mediterranei]
MNKLSIVIIGSMAVSPFALAEQKMTPPSIVAVEHNLVPLMQALVEAKQLDITVKGSADVPYSITNNKLAMGISSRKWKDREVAKFVQVHGYKPTELFFTADVIAIVANKSNQTQSISVAELKRVFGCHSQPDVVRWADGNGQSTIPMVPFAIDNQLVMHKEFSSWVTCKDDEYVATHFVSDKLTFLNEISGEEGALGYTVYSDELKDTNILKVTNRFGESYDVNKETILSGRYPLASVYYMYLNLPPNREYFNEQEEFFIGLTLSEEQKPVLNRYGFISLPPEAIQRNRIRLKLDEPMIEGGYK